MPVDSKATPKLPVIKFSSGLKENTPQWETVRKQVHEAFQQFGCFEAVYEDIPPSLAKATINAIKQLCDLPADAKLRYTSDEPFVGYSGNNPAMPFLEGFGLPGLISGESLGKLTTLMWPEGNPTFSESVRSFGTRLYELDKAVRRMLLESWGLERHIDEHIDSACYLVRIQKYSSTDRYPDCSSTVALPTHTDKSYVTILHQSEVNGLDVMTRDGQWTTFDPSYDNSFAVMIGDCYLALTNGRLLPCVHKVAAGARDRYMIALGSSPKWEGVVKVAPEMVDEEHPLQYKPFVYGEYAKYYSASYDDRKLANSLKEYCGA